MNKQDIKKLITNWHERHSNIEGYFDKLNNIFPYSQSDFEDGVFKLFDSYTELLEEKLKLSGLLFFYLCECSMGRQKAGEYYGFKEGKLGPCNIPLNRIVEINELISLVWKQYQKKTKS